MTIAQSKVVAILLSPDNLTLADREVARLCETNCNTVSICRKRLERSGAILPAPMRICHDGITRDVRRIGAVSRKVNLTDNQTPTN